MFLSRATIYHKLCNIRNYPRILKKYYAHRAINLVEPAVQRYFDYLLLENEKLLMKDEKKTDEVRRLREIKPVVSVLAQRMCLQKNIATLEESRKNEKDEDVLQMMHEEYEIYLKRAKEVEYQLQSVLLEPFLSYSGILLEIVAAEGDDAALFVKELFDLYKSYAAYKDWKVEMVSIDETERGFKRATLLIEGLGALEMMNLESGVHHRISREDQPNRISTVSVAVMLQPSKTEMDVPSSELIIETKEAESSNDDDSDAYSSVCITHSPTGTTVKCKTNKSNKLNKYMAMKELNTLLLYKLKAPSEQQDVGLIQSDRIIRTYDCSRDRVMEHRGGEDSQHRLKIFMEGGELLQRLQESLLHHQRYQALMSDIGKFRDKRRSKDPETYSSS